MMQIAKLTKALVFSTDLSQLSVKKITTALEGQLGAVAGRDGLAHEVYETLVRWAVLVVNRALRAQATEAAAAAG